MTTDIAKVAPETYLLFDRADDEAVIARIRGAALHAYVYHFRQGGQELYGLGIDGAEACKRELARTGEVIEEDDVQIERDEPEAAYFKARASRWAVSKDGQRIKLDSVLGMKRQTKFIHRRDGTDEPNPFWFEQGSSKAIRNAILNLVPEEIQQRVIEAYKKNGRVVTMTPETAADMAGDAQTILPTEEQAAKTALVVELQAAIVTLTRTKRVTRQEVDTWKQTYLGSPTADPRECDIAALSDLKAFLRSRFPEIAWKA